MLFKAIFQLLFYFILWKTGGKTQIYWVTTLQALLYTFSNFILTVQMKRIYSLPLQVTGRAGMSIFILYLKRRLSKINGYIQLKIVQVGTELRCVWPQSSLTLSCKWLSPHELRSRDICSSGGSPFLQQMTQKLHTHPLAPIHLWTGKSRRKGVEIWIFNTSSLSSFSQHLGLLYLSPLQTRKARTLHFSLRADMPFCSLGLSISMAHLPTFFLIKLVLASSSTLTDFYEISQVFFTLLSPLQD